MRYKQLFKINKTNLCTMDFKGRTSMCSKGGPGGGGEVLPGRWCPIEK